MKGEKFKSLLPIAVIPILLAVIFFVPSKKEKEFLAFIEKNNCSLTLAQRLTWTNQVTYECGSFVYSQAISNSAFRKIMEKN